MSTYLALPDGSLLRVRSQADLDECRRIISDEIGDIGGRQESSFAPLHAPAEYDDPTADAAIARVEGP